MWEEFITNYILLLSRHKRKITLWFHFIVLVHFSKHVDRVSTTRIKMSFPGFVVSLLFKSYWSFSF